MNSPPRSNWSRRNYPIAERPKGSPSHSNTVPAFAATSIKDDPTFAAVDRARKGEEEFLALARSEDAAEGRGIKLDKAPDDHRTPEMVAAVKEAIAARIALARTVPTTPEGLAALTTFIREESVERGEFYFAADDPDEQFLFVASLDDAVRGMAGLKPWGGIADAQTVDPIFAAIERHRQAENAYAGAYDSEEYRNAKHSTPATDALEERAGELGVAEDNLYVALVKLTPTTLAGCAVLLRYLEAHERSRGTEALFANNNAKEAARDLLSRIAAMLDAAVQS
jgi:hypothetical protein